ncbi:MAG: hypothetical protein ACOYYS_14030 [Chloroflexota bacterium]
MSTPKPILRLLAISLTLLIVSGIASAGAGVRAAAVQPDRAPAAAATIQVDYADVSGKGPDFYGVEYTWVDQAADRYLERFARLHANTLRVQITQQIFEPVNDNADPGISTIDFSRTIPLDIQGGTSLNYETMFTQIIAANPALHVQINVWLAARWNASDPDGYLGLGGAFPPLDDAEHAEFIRALARWLVQDCGIPADQLSFTFVNEANLPAFFAGNTQDLVRMAATTRAALDQVSPQIRMGGLDEVHGTQTTDAFYPLRPIGCCDFWTYHVYQYGTAAVIGELLDVSGGLRAYGPVWVTEFADTANGSPDARMDFSTVSAALGFAEMLGRTWGSGLEGLIHFRLSDTFAGLPAQWAGHGLFADSRGTHAGGQPYAIFPAYYVFANLYRELGGGQIVQTSAPPELAVVAARRDQARPRLAVWVTNPATAGIPVTITAAGFPAGNEGIRVQVFDNLVSDLPIRFDHVGSAGPAYALNLPARSAYLIVFEPGPRYGTSIYLPAVNGGGVSAWRKLPQPR